jgi:SagB-type dehydrogenase family enzyme
MPELETLQSIQYLQQSRHDRALIGGFRRPRIAPTGTFKHYPDAAILQLPTDWSLQEARITPLLQKRRSLRKFSNQPYSLADLSFMLWASQGVTARAGKHSLRTSPSAGALYPIETYLAIARVEGVEPGLYHLDTENFQLELVRPGFCGEDIALACLDQQFMSQAAVVFIWTAVFRRNFQKYGNRGFRYVLLDAGHICQNTLMAAEATGGGGCPVAAFFDEEMNRIVGVDGTEEATLYLAAIGLKQAVAVLPPQGD